jgi:TetR/AcrR family transcriptional regulator, tetracycline repressor protein
MSERPTTDDRQPRQALSRDLIVDAAIAAIDEEGLNALTMRSLGTRLRVEAMALYRYVNGREDLLEGVVDRLVDSIRVGPEERIEPLDGWQGFLQRLAHSVRSIATDHPAIFPLVATRHPAAPWLRPPLRSLRIVDEFLEGLTLRGLTDAQAVLVYRVFTSFLLGHLLLEVSSRGATTSPIEETLDEGDADIPSPETSSVDVTDYPNLLRTAHMLAEDRTEEEFVAALEALLDRLDRVLAQ